MHLEFLGQSHVGDPTVQAASILFTDQLQRLQLLEVITHQGACVERQGQQHREGRTALATAREAGEPAAGQRRVAQRDLDIAIFPQLAGIGEVKGLKKSELDAQVNRALTDLDRLARERNLFREQFKGLLSAYLGSLEAMAPDANLSDLLSTDDDLSDRVLDHLSNLHQLPEELAAAALLDVSD